MKKNLLLACALAASLSAQAADVCVSPDATASTEILKAYTALGSYTDARGVARNATLADVQADIRAHLQAKVKDAARVKGARDAEAASPALVLQ